MRRSLRAFFRRDEGSVAIEGLFGAALLLGWFMVAYEIYDAFRARAQVSTGAYTVADLISRQKSAIGPTWVEGTKRIFDQVARTRAAERSWLRVTLVTCPAASDDTATCDGIAKEFRMDVSYATGGHAALTQDTLDTRAGAIPMMAAGDTAVIVEASYNYLPVFGIGDRTLTIDDVESRMGLTSALTFREFVVTRPRGPRPTWNAEG